MADRTSAALFGKIFDLLAKNPSDENKAIAKEIWPMSCDYDFAPYQMNADESLIKLGLAKMGKLDGEDEDGVIYRTYY